ncbi:oxidoreductase [Anaerocolumna cellulosilytica]|uniref:Oxidoreductase n=1 Tax=Anaerocolumna cellulosilytica TaxID=433286 RepID=A0A6S6QRH2_9FIRM|nr:Gfo/Idh/MocA family oxidoreductase [Anaerocolumna cellulosilytica]MBB5196681.1 putative dehydrogenase [Anaerocolumna cellulosilytica]BCJ93943.1 oxidoreductase [Anaerocolumna cellulosilytica]
MKNIKLGIIGIGNMGSGHCNSILEGKVPLITISAVADKREVRRTWAKENLPKEVAIFEEGDALIASGLCDAVLVATPHYEHPSLVIKAFKQGLHVLCEKPAGVYTKQVREMNESAEKHNLVFAMMFNQRTNHVYRKMHELVHGGELGAIKRVNWIITDWYRTQAYYDSGDWRATWEGEGGGVLLNQCPHNLDLLQWICGMPKKVMAVCHNGKWHDIEVEDDVTAYLEYPNGATGVFITSTADAPGTNRFEIDLEKGKLVCEEDKLTLYKLDVSEREYCFAAREGFKKPDGQFIELITDGCNPQHIGVMRAFADRILYGTPLVAEGVEGIHGLMLSNAMHLSSWLNKPVTLPFDEELFLGELNKRRKDSKYKKTVKEITFDLDGSYGSK